jgi:hypothetical protein
MKGIADAAAMEFVAAKTKMADYASLIRPTRYSSLKPPQHIPVHLAAVEMKKRHFRIVAQGAGGEALFEFVEDIPGHRMQVGERL